MKVTVASWIRKNNPVSVNIPVVSHGKIRFGFYGIIHSTNAIQPICPVVLVPYKKYILNDYACLNGNEKDAG